ncbi:Protein CHROMATIN REMODELING like [Actinidia chinensis var. chinensis]|uniref:Protein CHROMATIN REMODELING like n=1 Tax=Actinidia chinensis var. chinensis TaxID=1590841 RepID=A0A2R6RDE4_ACTCC|nr:Protein CHROMATIN REMODELING like [Actinidia chinensis var. chinensis]
MAEKKKKNPMSLNDRHYRLLQGLSASQSRPHFRNQEDEQSKGKFDLCDDFSRFTGIADFDSPSPRIEESEKSTVKLDVCDDVPLFTGIADFDSPSPEKSEKSTVKLDVCADVPRFSGIADFDSSSLGIVELNPSKFKVEGSSKDEQSEVQRDLGNDVPRFSGITDLDSPSPVETKPPKFEVKSSSKVRLNKEDDDCVSGITDQRVKEKPCRVKIEGKVSYLYHLDGGEIKGDKPSKVKMEGRRRLCKVSSKDNSHDYNDSKNRTANDDPAFSGLSDFDSPSSSRDTVERNTDGGNEIRDILNDLSCRLEFLSMEKKRGPKMVDLRGESLAFVKNVDYSQAKKEDFPEYTSAASSFSLPFDSSCSSSDATIQYMVGRGIATRVDENLDEIDQESESEVDNLVGKHNRPMNAGKGQKKDETKRVDGKSVSMRESFVAKFEGQDKDDDDCVILSGQNFSKQLERRYSKIQERFDDSSKVDLLDNNSDDSVYDDKYCITMRDPKLSFVLPGKIGKMLYPHQRDGLKWLWSLHCQGKGGILGDDMGLGKTMQICGFLAGLFHSCLIKRALVVSPKTLLPHWIKELSAVGLSEMTKEYFGTCAKARQYELQYILQDKGILLTTYDIVRNNAKSLRGDYYFRDERNDDITWDYMLLDEGHLIKNPGTQRAKSLLEIPSAHRIVISGTPIQNNLKELWALFNFCCPELLGDKNRFKEKYEYAILRGNDKNASDREKCIGSTVAKELREHIQPYFLRRLKSEVFREDDTTEGTKLSKKNEIIVWLKLTSCQQQLYEAFLKSELVLSAFDGSPLAALTV